ncbi:MAG: hypothetical protein HY081_05550 [Gammaproteobacteria bacterium]|nr:hypothetical protein [Gammaproteobacteria bacterium]
MSDKTAKARERRNKARRLLAKRRKAMRWKLENLIRRKSPGRRTTDRSVAADAKKSENLLSTLAGLCVLTSTGLLGYFTAERKFVINTELTQALLNYAKEFLKVYKAAPQTEGRRIGIIYAPEKNQAWHSATLLMEETVVRHLYPVQGQATAKLTVFQKKKQENSLYRGMELLLEAMNEAMPGIPKYCPVLYDRGTTLADYPELAVENAADKKSPVIEVLNLIAAMPFNNHDIVKIIEVIHNVHNRIVKKDLRKPLKFELINKVGMTPWSDEDFSTNVENISQPPAQKIPAPVAVIDQPPTRAIRSQAPALKQFEKWLEIPNRPVTAAALKKFAAFKKLNDRELSTLAAKSLVFRAPPGTLLLDRGSNDPWNLFLLTGQVALETAKESRIVVAADSKAATLPIAAAKPRKCNVRAVTAVAFLWIHENIIGN